MVTAWTTSTRCMKEFFARTSAAPKPNSPRGNPKAAFGNPETSRGPWVRTTPLPAQAHPDRPQTPPHLFQCLGRGHQLARAHAAGLVQIQVGERILDLVRHVVVLLVRKRGTHGIRHWGDSTECLWEGLLEPHRIASTGHRNPRQCHHAQRAGNPRQPPAQSWQGTWGPSGSGVHPGSQPLPARRHAPALR